MEEHLNLDGGDANLDRGTLTLDGGTRPPYNLSFANKVVSYFINAVIASLESCKLARSVF